MSSVLYLIRLFPLWFLVNSFDAAICGFGNGTISEMDGRWWDPGFSPLEWEFIGKQWEKARMIPVVVDSSSRYQYELI